MKRLEGEMKGTKEVRWDYMLPASVPSVKSSIIPWLRLSSSQSVGRSKVSSLHILGAAVG